MKTRRPRPVCEIVALEARKLLCSNHLMPGTSSFPPADGDVGVNAAMSGPESIDQLTVPAFSSRPSAGRKLYLDFNGHGAIDNWNGWSEFGGKSVTATQAYDIDGDNNTYNAQELANILQIWKGVSEKFSPFNVDVTTIRPNTINGVRVVIGGDGAWAGGGGGIASIGGWGEEGFTDANSGNVAFVWSGQSPSNPNYIIEAAAHEAGHTLGLYHHSFSPIATNEYAPGFIMGGGGRWANTSVNGTIATSRDDDGVKSEGSQNDLNKITSGNGFGFRADDVGNTIGVATFLPLTSNSGVLEGAALGVIEQMTDADVYRITHNGGSLDIEVLAAEFGRMLDPRMELLTSTGTLIQFSAQNDGSDGFGERITLNQLNAGTYYISIFGSTAYGDIGQYRLNLRAGLATTAFNDTVGTATRLFVHGNTDVATFGSLGYGGTSIINDGVASNDTIDYFRFVAPANTTQVYTRLSGLTTSASLAVYNDLNGNGIIETGEILGANNPSTSTQTINITNANAGTAYYVRVMKSSSAGAGNYQLRITTDAARPSLPPSVVASTFNAPLLGSKIVYESIDAAAGDTTDYYRVTAEAAGLISLYMYDTQFIGDLRLDVGNDANSNGIIDAGEFLGTSAIAGQTTEFLQNIPIASGQTLLVRVIQQAAGTSSNYYLQAVADYATGGNTTGSLVNARDLTNRGAGTIFEYFDSSVDFFDTFKIAPNLGTIQARFNALESGAGHKLEIIRDSNNNGTVDSGEIVASGFQNVLLTHNVTAGAQYYLRMQSILGGEFFSVGNYKLTYASAGTVTSFGTPGTAGDIVVNTTQQSLTNYLAFDPTDPTQTNTTDYYRFTLSARTRVDLAINAVFLPPPASLFGIAIGQDDGSGNFQRLAGLGANQGIQTALNVNLDPGTYLIRAYLPVGEREQEALGGNYTLQYKTSAITDNSPPVVTPGAFQFEIAPTGVSFTFNQSVAGTVDVTDVSVINLDNALTHTIGRVFYDDVQRRAGYGFAAGVLPDGNYRATLRNNRVRDAAANGNVGDTSFNFFVLAADANRDRRVNLDDFTQMAANFGLPNRTFSTGDFNYDYSVNLDDFTLLASKFGNTLSAPTASRTTAPPPLAAADSKLSTDRVTSSLFSDRLVLEGAVDESV